VPLPSEPSSTPRATGNGATAVLDLTVSTLCAWIERLEHLQNVQIFSTESYTQQIGLFKPVMHRFLVLELQRVQDPKDACLRLDRRRGKKTSCLRGMAPFSENEANDRVSLSRVNEASGSDHPLFLGNVYHSQGPCYPTRQAGEPADVSAATYSRRPADCAASRLRWARRLSHLAGMLSLSQISKACSLSKRCAEQLLGFLLCDTTAPRKRTRRRFCARRFPP
jgi:hypothetical protein